ncbi:hypothetical protein K435DRAFT_880034 [Dendrothele bispora CBS 962.96]|uniref:Uncharacterized protein n=1 Tax=Dendrothele bispora (strain CBS 962.96) TaxID=1314807 RepID=A0A4S8KK86_DENBC|nr:hypothetical protein K435DRAFT_880034 [Dendrothele bispora CBS 962.96]
MGRSYSHIEDEGYPFPWCQAYNTRTTVFRGNQLAYFFIPARIADHAKLNRGPPYFTAGKTTDDYALKEEAVRRARYKTDLVAD